MDFRRLDSSILAERRRLQGECPCPVCEDRRLQEAIATSNRANLDRDYSFEFCLFFLLVFIMGLVMTSIVVK